MLIRLIKDPLALALTLSIPAWFLVFDLEGSDWHVGIRPSRLNTERQVYQYMWLSAIWVVAIIRWKWQKEDKAKQG